MRETIAKFVYHFCCATVTCSYLLTAAAAAATAKYIQLPRTNAVLLAQSAASRRPDAALRTPGKRDTDGRGSEQNGRAEGSAGCCVAADFLHG